jgi:hypothetical protein
VNKVYSLSKVIESVSRMIFPPAKDIPLGKVQSGFLLDEYLGSFDYAVGYVDAIGIPNAGTRSFH